METDKEIEAMINHSTVDPHNTWMNKNPLDSSLIYKYQQLDAPLI